MSLSSSADLSSSSRLCRSTVARPFSINCSEMLLHDYQSRPRSRSESRGRNDDPLVLITVGDGDAFPLFKVALFRLDIVDQDLDSLANEAFT